MVGFALTRSQVGSVAGRELDGLNVASLACGERGHRGLRQVAAGDGPLVVLIGEDGAEGAARDVIDVVEGVASLVDDMRLLEAE